jgi:hypothetical protein
VKPLVQKGTAAHGTATYGGYTVVVLRKTGIR